MRSDERTGELFAHGANAELGGHHREAALLLAFGPFRLDPGRGDCAASTTKARRRSPSARAPSICFFFWCAARVCWSLRVCWFLRMS